MGGAVSGRSTTTTGAEAALLARLPPTDMAPPPAESVDEAEPLLLLLPEEEEEGARAVREDIRDASWDARAPQLPLTLHLRVSLHVCSGEAAVLQGSNTVSDLVAWTESPLSGPVAMYDTSQGPEEEAEEEVAVLVNLDGGEFSVTTEMAPEIGSVA